MPMLVVNSDPERLWGKKEIPDYTEQYLTIEALEDCTITFNIWANIPPTNLEYISYSTDNGKTWTKTDNIYNTKVVITVENVKKGDSVLWKGKGDIVGVYAQDYTNVKVFDVSGKFNINGNIMSLLYSDDFIGKSDFLSTNSYQFAVLFKDNTNLISAQNLILPATTLRSYCYSRMFQGCTSLTIAPELPATTLNNYCYSYMFQGCTSLTIAPKLPATTLNNYCYDYMFRSCTNLTYIKILATDNISTSTLSMWLYNASTTGTFVKVAGVEYPAGTSGIPSGWTVEEV